MIAPPTAALVVCSVLAVGCSGEQIECTVPDGAEPDWIGRLGCEADYQLLWDERSDAIFARTRTINWLIDREDDDRVYFINTRVYLLHYQFASDYLDYGDPFSPVGSHAEFNILNYRRDNRRFALGKLIRYLDQDLVTLEISAGDTADADMIVDSFERVRSRLHDGDRLVYRPVSAGQEAMLADIERRIPVVRTGDVFRGQSYQPLNQVVGYGTLRFRRLPELAAEPIAPTDIVVLDRVPNDIALVSGIVTAEFQTPLSHINILSKNRGTPNMALRGAWNDPDLRALEDQLVRIDVAAQNYQVGPATIAEAETYWSSLRPTEPLVPTFDESDSAPVDLDQVGANDAHRIGAKAANLAELMSIRIAGAAIVAPDAPFAVPFGFYQQHLADNGLDIVLADLLAAANTLEPDELRQRLFDLRWQIYRAPMDPDRLDQVLQQAAARWGSGARVRFRSSTNVEDLPGFSGAGLYTSAGADLAGGAAAVERAIKVVWASTWNEQAFVERSFYRVDHSRVRMAVLVHPSMPDELANGVAVTINEFADNRPAYYINGQLGEVSVTNPTGLATPEQILYYTWYEQPEYEVITRSSLVGQLSEWPAGPALLTDGELDTLASYLGAIHGHFSGQNAGGSDFAMDVEWKLAPGRVITIKQARPLVRR